jgi:hypothetical protein
MSDSETKTSTPSRHDRFYFTDDLITFLVGGKLMRVHKPLLERYSSLFATMFELPQDQSISNAEGQSDENPIVIQDAPLEEFEAFLEMVYELQFKAPETSGDMWMNRLSAATRWDAPDLRAYALKNLGASDDILSQLLTAHRFDIPTWLWPALHHLCTRRDPLAVAEISALKPLEIVAIMSIREHIKDNDAMKTLPYAADQYAREALTKKLQLNEPACCEVAPPLSGYRVRVKEGEPFPTELAGTAPFRDADTDRLVYLGSVHHDEDVVVPCKIIPEFDPPAGFPYGDDEEWSNNYEVLPFDSSKMEWVKTSEGHIPEGRRPIEGGFDYGERLFHAYAVIDGFQVPGKTSESLGSARVPWGGVERSVEEDYFILCWK